MHSFLSVGIQALVLASLCFTVFGRERQLRAKRIGGLVEREQEQSVDKRGICYDDDTYESFKYWIVDSAPYCSSLLGLSDFTRTVSRISRTTTTTVSVTYATRTATVTVPAVTIFSTPFVPSATNLLNKREAAAATTVAPNFYDENPYAYPLYAGDAVNASIAYSYYSACSCLSLKPSTVDDTSIILTTRTLNGLDTRETTSLIFVTTGTTTSVLTRQGPPAPITGTSTVPVVPTPPLTTAHVLTSAVGTGSSIVGSLSSSVLPPFPSSNASLSLSNTLASSTTIAPTSNLTSFSVPSLTPTISVNSTTRLPTITAPSSSFPSNSLNASLTTRPSSGFSSFPAGNLSTSLASTGLPTVTITSTRPSSGLPTVSINLTITSRPSASYPISLVNSSSTRASSLFPTFSANSSSIPIPNYGSAGLSTVFVTVTAPSPSPSNSTLAYTQTGLNTTSLFPTITTTQVSNLTATSATTVALTALPTLDPNSCPNLNGTVITLEDGQAFAIICSTEYGGPVDIGLSERSFRDCVEDCATTNNGFSAPRCRAVSYLADQATGEVNCNFKSLAGLAEAYNNPKAISAVLIKAPLLNVTIAAPSSFPTHAPTTLARVVDDEEW